MPVLKSSVGSRVVSRQGALLVSSGHRRTTSKGIRENRPLLRIHRQRRQRFLPSGTLSPGP